MFGLGAVRAQAAVHAPDHRSPRQPVFIARSYFRHGFHEDAFASALECSRVVIDADAAARA